MDRFQQMQVFVAVVEKGHFVTAAEALGLSKAAVSRTVSSLEARLGVRLLHRTTRRLSLTGEGAVFHRRCRDLLMEVEAAEGEVSEQGGRVSGRIRVNAPVSFGIHYLAPFWADFAACHPRVSLDVTLSDRVVDLVEEAYDLAIRIGQLSSSSMVARRLATTRLLLCASPDYLATAGEPERPQKLAEHAVIAYSYLTSGDDWTLTGPGGAVTVKTRPVMHSNNGETCVAAALGGQGIILQPDFLVHEYLADGRLRELLPAWSADKLGIHAVYPNRRYLPPRVRVLIDALAERMSVLSRQWR